MKSLLLIGQNGSSGQIAQKSVKKMAQRENVSARENALLLSMHHTVMEMTCTAKSAMI